MEENISSRESYISRTSGLKAKDYIGYALGDAAGCMVFSLVTNLLQKFYTDIFLINPMFIMVMFIVARLWDAINDPIMGRICDKMKPNKSGKYKRWFLYISLPLAISAILMFVDIPGISYAGKYIYATATYIIFGMAYTVLQIPYGSLASVVTTDDKERSKLSTFRSIGAAVGSIPVLLITSFAYTTALDNYGNPIKYPNGTTVKDMNYKMVIIGVVIMAAVSALMLLATYFLNKERVVYQPVEKEKGSTKKAIRNIFKNKAFISLAICAMLLLAGQMFTQSYYTYLFNDYFGDNSLNMLSMVCTYSPMIIFMFFIPKLVRKFGKKEICSIGLIIASAANLIMFFLEGIDVGILKWIFLGLCFVSGCGLTLFVMQLWSMATDAIDDIEIRTGSRDDGTSYSFFNFFRKMGQVISAIAVNGALLLMNYDGNPGAVQSDENLVKMYRLATIIPAAMFGIMAVVLLLVYPLSKKTVADNQVKKEALLAKKYEDNEIVISE